MTETTDWKPIESAPENETPVLAKDADGNRFVARYATGTYPHGWVLDYYDAISVRPIQWMDLP